MDISGDGSNVDVYYNLKTGTWTEEDSIGDSNGYGHASGEEDGSTGSDEDDCEIWFEVYQNDYDNDGLVYWEEVNMYGTNPMEKNHYKFAIMVCGGAIGDPAQPTFENTIQHAYNTLKDIGYNDEDIYYLNVDASKEGVDQIATKNNIQEAITNWLASRSKSYGECFIYLINHGTDGGYFAVDSNGDGDLSDSEDYIRDYELDSWIDQVVYSTCTVVIEACFSGDFIDDLSEDNRIVITSSNGSQPSYGISGGEAIFSKAFFDTMGIGLSYGHCWEAGDSAVAKSIHPEQNPQIDDNGDGNGHGTTSVDHLPVGGDGLTALSTYP